MKPSEYAVDIPVPDWAYAIADAVIAELGLQRASRPNDYGHVDYPAGDRYITDWIATDD